MQKYSHYINIETFKQKILKINIVKSKVFRKGMAILILSKCNKSLLY